RLTVTDAADETGDKTKSVNVTGAPKRGDTEAAPRALSFALLENYPNPFASSTAIRFSIAEQSQVHLVVFDGSGRKVVTLLDSPLEAGHYAQRWTPSGLAAGVYYFRLTAGPFDETG